MIDASAVETALMGRLASDPELAALLPDGVFFDLARDGATMFVIVSLSASRVLPEINDGETFRALIYLVKAVARGADADPIVAAEHRIHALLDHATLDLPGSGGALMTIRWIDRLRYTERAGAETWQHRGARYELIVTPL